MDMPTSDSKDECDGGTISESEGSEDSKEEDDTLFDPEAISDVESDASNDDESIETLSASSGLSGGQTPGLTLPRFQPQRIIQFLHDIIVICRKINI